MARPLAPLLSVTSASTVGFPRESRTSRACTRSISVIDSSSLYFCEISASFLKISGFVLKAAKRRELYATQTACKLLANTQPPACLHRPHLNRLGSTALHWEQAWTTL